MKKINNLVIFGITLVLITSGGSLKINKNQDKFYNKVNKYTSEFQEDNYLVCAHRGFSSKEIENTSKSIKKANNSKYIDYIEMDMPIQSRVLGNRRSVLRPFVFYLNKSAFDPKLQYIEASFPPRIW